MLSWFLSTKRFKKILANLKLHKNKSAWSKRSDQIYWTCNWIGAFVIYAHNYQGCTGIKSALLSSSEGLTLGVLTFRRRRRIHIRKKDKYIGRRSNFVSICKKMMHELKKLHYQLHIYSSSFMKCITINELKSWSF